MECNYKEMAEIIVESIEYLDFDNLAVSEKFNIELLTTIFCCAFSIHGESDNMEMTIRGVDVNDKDAEFAKFMEIMVEGIFGGKQKFYDLFIKQLHYYERYEILGELMKINK